MSDIFHMLRACLLNIHFLKGNPKLCSKRLTDAVRPFRGAESRHGQAVYMLSVNFKSVKGFAADYESQSAVKPSRKT